ncbi:unnamed protein product [Adineta steineri]|uniref:Uncharacterized protein n=2 Tax=Adineta steineri TaxID=433720 RepID=A0A815QPH8_9BILA|nr:unnamed protein product [Adineta steineri]
MLIIKGRIFPVLTIRPHTFETKTITPARREFHSYSELEKFVRYSIDPLVIPGVTTHFGFDWMGNIGHSLFDALYPAYVALIRFPPRHVRPFRILATLRECDGCRDEEIVNRFAGVGLLKQYVLNDMSIGNWFVFDELVMGCGLLCQRCTQPNLQLPGGVELDASRLFRDRMYAQHGIIAPLRRHRSSREGRNTHDVLRAYIIENKRFTAMEWKEINAAIDEVNNYTLTYQNQSITNSTKLNWPLINAKILRYGSIMPQKKQQSRFNKTITDAKSPTYELTENRFMAQLRLFRTIDIHVTGPGTGQMYQTFLPDGSVNINLGGLQELRRENGNRTFTTYMEQYMTSGAPYLKGLYYPINERPNGIKRKQVVRLIREAAKMIMDGFSIPVNPIESLAPDGKLYIEMCEKDKQFCSLTTDRAEGVPFGCYHFWIDEVIHERGVWRSQRKSDGTIKSVCPFNRTLLYELRKKYGIHHYD